LILCTMITGLSSAEEKTETLVPQVYVGKTPPPIVTTLGNALPVNGYFVQEVVVGEAKRSAKVFIPEGMPIRGYFTIVNVPDGWNTEEFLLKSGWIDVMEARKEGLFVLEPDSKTGAWGDIKAEAAYIKAALAVLEGKKFYSTHGVYYIAGYGTGGNALEDYVANNPLFVISAVFIDTNDLDNLGAIGAQKFELKPKFTPTAMDPRFNILPYNEVPVPVWFVNQKAASVSKLINYWKFANDVSEVVKDDLVYGKVFSQKADSKRMATSYSDPVSKVAVLEKKVRYDDKNFTWHVYKFMSFYTRYDNTSAFGNVLGTRPDYEKLGVEIKNMIVVEDDGQVWKREYMVYVPKNSKDIFPYKAPVVYVFAGGSQPNRLFFDITRWWEVADKYGFILVVPCSQYSSGTPLETRWNFDNTTLDVRANDFVFMKQLIQEVESQYDIDPHRRFAVGHSNGSMFCHGMAYRMPEYFTAMGGSGASTNPFEGAATSVMPFFLSYGENDNGNYLLSQEGGLRNIVSYWLKRNGLADVDHPDVIKGGVGILERTLVYSWTNKQGIPLFVYSVTAGRPHNVSVDSNWTFWEDWFSKWDRDDAGNRYFEGQLVR